MDLITNTLHHLGKNYKDIQVIQIGAMDGISFDDTRGFLDMYGWASLLVEPIPEIFKELKENFKDRTNYIFEQSAITESNGTVDMLTVPLEVIQRENLHPGYKGMSALYPLKNGFGSDYERDIYVRDNLAVNVKVNSLTFNSLLQKHDIQKFDIFICDAEGYDYKIFKQINLEKYKPKFIRLEYINLTESEKKLTEEVLKTNNYIYQVCGQNIDAVHPDIFKEIQSNNVVTKSKNALEEIVEKHGSDKILSGYTEVYFDIFTPIKDKVTTILEIGVGTLNPSIPSSYCGITNHYSHYKPGGSLRAWRDFFPNANVYGVDVAEDCKITEERIKTFIFSSLDQNECDKHLSDFNFDIIIDDGLHTAEAQYQTFKNLFSKVKYNGYYVIEDLGGGGDNLNMFDSHYDKIKDVIELHEFYFRGNMLVIKKNYSKKKKVNNPPKDISVSENKEQEKDPSDVTIVTGYWNIARPGRPHDHYMNSFDQLLKIPNKLFLYIPKEFEEFVWQRRQKHNTHVRIFELSDIKNLFSPFWDRVQNIRTKPEWYNQASWLAESPQAKVEWYNPIVMSKMFMLHDASILNPFNTSNFIWIDGGITNTVNYKWLADERALDKMVKHLDPFMFICYPYITKSEIHGFEKIIIDRYARKDVQWVARGGIFGGTKEAIREANSTYYHLLDSTLTNGYMGTEECIFTIMAHLEPWKYRRYMIKDDGLILTYIINLLADKAELEPVPENKLPSNKPTVFKLDKIKTYVYILTFNFPQQLRVLLESFAFEEHREWLDKTNKVLIDNSTDPKAKLENQQIAKEYGFVHYQAFDNIGINGGRQYAAEHFDTTDGDFYIFFEDDMCLHGMWDVENSTCRNGFVQYVPNLLEKIQKIMIREKFDFLKLSFTEVYMDNNIQCSWYNVPQEVRTKVWPHYDILPVTGLDANCPRTKFTGIDSYDGLAFATGDVYYCNWPMIVSKKGNRKMFLETKWARPFEQTFMSHMFQLTIAGNLNPAVLLASPINHNRIKHYKAEERREN